MNPQINIADYIGPSSFTARAKRIEIHLQTVFDDRINDAFHEAIINFNHGTDNAMNFRLIR